MKGINGLTGVSLNYHIFENEGDLLRIGFHWVINTPIIPLKLFLFSSKFWGYLHAV